MCGHRKTILSLFDYSGQWPRPWREAGYDVIQVDIQNGENVYTLDIDTLPPIHGILAALPCTEFASSGARWWKFKDEDGRTFGAIALAYRTLEIIWKIKHRDNLAFWALENPVGRLNRMVPELASYGPFYFQPCEFGDPYTKKTGLWGEFVYPTPLVIGSGWQVEATEGSMMWARLGGKSQRTKNKRSITPLGFAKAFYKANKTE